MNSPGGEIVREMKCLTIIRIVERPLWNAKEQWKRIASQL